MDIEFGTGAINAVVRIREKLGKEEYVEAITAAEALVSGAGRIRVLALLDGFTGWGDADWDDDRINSYAMEHDDDIERLAVVGPPEWKDQVLAFTGYPFTAKDVRYFDSASEAEARAWLSG